MRDGKRIKVIDAEFFSNGVSMARATSQLLLRTENPPGKVWSRPDWNAPRPAEFLPPTDKRAGMNGMWAMRPIEGTMGTLGPRKIWMSEVRETGRRRPADTVHPRGGVGRFRKPVRECRRCRGSATSTAT